ncbi:MAG: thermonuclease family protein [Oceanicaulis sp.]
MRLRFSSPRRRDTLVIAMVMVLFPGACARDAEPRGVEARAEQVWSGTSFEIETAGGERERVVLAGVSAPDPERRPEAARAARAALTSRLEARAAAVRLAPAAEPARDRYDRLIASVRTVDGDLAEALVGAGHLIVWPRPGETLDFSALHAAEARAREAGAGGWASGAFAVHGPDPNALAQHLDSAVIVEGLVADTGEARDGRAFVNFGLDWRTDFTATADRRSRAAFEAAGIDLMALEGARIRVRGWLYATNGPSISLTHPAQLELVDAPEPRTLR